MNETQRYFIHLLSSHLNNSPPLPNESADWMGVFKLGELHNVTGMLCLSIKKLSPENRPEKKIMSLFNQALGLTVQRYDSKIKGIEKLCSVFDENDIRYLFLKGAAIRQYYPVPEVRTSGDTDVVVDKDIIIPATKALENSGFELESQNKEQSVLFYLNEEFEIKSSIDALNDKCRAYFEPTFNPEKCVNTDNMYYLNPENHLIYIISHFLRHITTGGVGIRQLMDVDILIRNADVNFEKVLNIAKEINLEKSTSVILALSKEYFNTPISLNFIIDDTLKEKLESIIIEGGVFGDAISNSGTFRLIRSINSTGKSNTFSSFHSLYSLVFVRKERLYSMYPYADKHHSLLPVAFFNRLSDAAFKRGKKSKESIKTILSNRETATTIVDILNELEIEKDF